MEIVYLWLTDIFPATPMLSKRQQEFEQEKKKQTGNSSVEWNGERQLREKEKKSGDKKSQEEKRKCKHGLEKDLRHLRFLQVQIFFR